MTVQVPALMGVKFPSLSTAQNVDPEDEYETFPVPEPPVTVNLDCVPHSTVVALEVRVSAACGVLGM